MDSPYPYEGPQDLRGPIEQALRRVVSTRKANHQGSTAVAGGRCVVDDGRSGRRALA